MPNHDRLSTSSTNPQRLALARPLEFHSNFNILTHTYLRNVTPKSSTRLVQNGHGAAEQSLDGIVEYRVYNYRHLPSGRVVRGDGWTALDLAVLLFMAWIAGRVPWKDWKDLLFEDWESRPVACVWPLLLLLVLISLGIVRSQTVLYQSVTIDRRTQSLELSTARGLSLPSLWSSSAMSDSTTAKRELFVFRRSKRSSPLADISTVIINEGLTRWNVRYYLALMRRNGESIVLPFNLVMPAHAVLVEVYHAIRFEIFQMDQDHRDLRT